MRLSPSEFRSWKNRCITLVGMAGVGKTRVSSVLRRENWFHYSADYRIGTRYLNEPILDNIKRQAMGVPFLRSLLRSDSIYICNNITVDNLHPVTSFLGRLGNPEEGGLALGEFLSRQARYLDALRRTMEDVPEFIRKARQIYGYDHFINDTAGSVCELEAPELIATLAKNTLLLYVQPTEADAESILRDAEQDLRPLCYRRQFFEEQLVFYLRERGLSFVALVEPGDFYRWMLPRLYAARVPRYEAMAARFGYTVSARDLGGVATEDEFLALVEHVLESSPPPAE